MTVDYTAAGEAADAARLAVAARQLLTAGRPERDLCSAVLADEWAQDAPRCPERAVHYVCFDTYRSGVLAEGVFTPGEAYTRLCDGHEEQVRRGPGWRWTHALTPCG
jgi:hypothetical protein